MGFFSWECKHCGKSIRAEAACGKNTGWMNKAVCITSDGSIIKGSYDGYGSITTLGGEFEMGEYEEPCLYHAKCWEEAGKPTEYSPSKSARDQGYFVDDPELDEEIREARNERRKALEQELKGYEDAIASGTLDADGVKSYEFGIKMLKRDLENIARDEEDDRKYQEYLEKHPERRGL